MTTTRVENLPAWDIGDVRQTIWLTRPDIQAVCQDDPNLFDIWLTHVARADYAALDEFGAEPDPSLLEQPFAGSKLDDGPVLTQFMANIRACRPDLKQAFDLDTPQGRQGLVEWFFLHGTGELKLARFITATQWSQLLQPVPDYQPPAQPSLRGLASSTWNKISGRQSNQQALPWILTRILARRKDLLAHFDPHTRTGRRGLIDWFEGHGKTEYALTCRGPADHPASPPGVPAPFGVNLIGYARGQFGIGEDVRMAALACEAAHIPFSIYNIEPGSDVAQNDTSADHHISNQLPYAINLFCTTGIETARLAASDGRHLFANRYCIGYWPWELPAWPEEWSHAYKLVDEVWASSTHTRDAYETNSPKPVKLMPMAVETGPVSSLQRADFGLPENTFLFVFAFDFLSSMQRKNPQACVEAFLRAFPSSDDSVGLVVKVMRPADDNPQWQELLKIAREDGRIYIVDKTLDRADVMALFKSCDCFVSLHRAEGFGRGLAEAMLLSIPVIATGWSGNADFCTPDTAAMVDFELVPLEPGAYPFGEGQLWAEPSVEHAATQMRRVKNDQARRDTLVDRARTHCYAVHSAEAVGKHYSTTLNGIFERQYAANNTP